MAKKLQILGSLKCSECDTFTEEAAMIMLAESDVCSPVSDVDGSIMTDDLGIIYSL